MRKLVIWYLRRKLKNIKHEMESVEINQDIIEGVNDIYNILKIKKQAVQNTITMLESEEF
ncbi:MAG: hypothetical protein ACOCZ5_03545 [bacterium]